MSKPPIFEDWPATLPTPWGPYRAVVASIYDGDTPRFWEEAGLKDETATYTGPVPDDTLSKLAREALGNE